MKFTKQGPKRRRHTRRQLWRGEGHYSQWMYVNPYNFKREREKRLLAIEDKEVRP